MKNQKVQVQLFGKAGTHIAEVQPKGFGTRHVRTGRPVQTEPLEDYTQSCATATHTRC